MQSLPSFFPPPPSPPPPPPSLKKGEGGRKSEGRAIKLSRSSLPFPSLPPLISAVHPWSPPFLPPLSPPPEQGKVVSLSLSLFVVLRTVLGTLSGGLPCAEINGKLPSPPLPFSFFLFHVVKTITQTRLSLGKPLRVIPAQSQPWRGCRTERRPPQPPQAAAAGSRRQPPARREP